MAAPTNARVEATSQTTATVRWTYGGAAAIAVYQSTDGSNYSELTNIDTRVAVGTLSYSITGLSPGTKYWYRLSDDAGSTFSSVVTVYSHSCLEPAGDNNTFVLPRTNGQGPTVEFDELSERIERALNGRVLNPSQCIACPSDGAVVIDCSEGCNDWVVIADEDINSMTVNWCGEGEGNIEFLIPPNSTRCIGGWPLGFGFSGDEAQQACITTGSSGRSMNVGFGGGGRASPSSTKSRPGYNKGIGNGGGPGGADCNCVPNANGGLTIKSCNANNSLNCSSTKSLKLIACGGRGPYTWSKTGSVVLSRISGDNTTVTPPANSGSGVAGTAYVKYGGTCLNSGGVQAACPGNSMAVYASNYGCNDQVLAACGSVSIGVANTGSCVTNPVNVGAANCASVSPCADNGTCTNGSCDARTAGMISDGCVPCGVNAGATVTVTDSLGTQTTIILTA